jgi:flagellar assembly factor FliW
MTASVESAPAAENVALPVIDFVAPMPGFPGERRFLLVRLDDTGVLYALTSIETPGLRFLVVPPAPFFPEYAPEIDDETLSALAVEDPANLLVLLVVTTGESTDDVTVNLMAPIVLDRETRRAVQLVLPKSDLPIRERLRSAE